MLRRALITLTCGSILAALSVTTGAAAQDDEQFNFFLGQKPKPYIDPAGYYAAILPTGFDCEAKPRSVKCTGNRGVQAVLTIDVLDVPLSATSDIAMLNQMDKFKQKPHFKLLQQGKVKIDKTPAVVVNFAYDYMGNVEYQVAVEELIMVRGGKLYLIHQEMRLDQLATHKKDLEQLYRSFKPARLDAGGNPILEDLKPVPVGGSTGNLPEIDKALKGGF